jgi:hypothetical protein
MFIVLGYGPCPCTINHHHLAQLANMSTDLKLHLTMLAADGSNWIMYYNCISWLLKMRGLSNHLTSIIAIAPYKNTGTVNRLTPKECWTVDKNAASQLISAIISDYVFYKIKMANHVKEL